MSTDISAVAVFYISESDIQNVFKVRTSETNISDISYSNLLHFIHMDQWPSDLILNPFNGKMDQALSENAILTFGNPDDFRTSVFVFYIRNSTCFY